MTETTLKRLKDLPSERLLGSGTPMCAGCGGLEAIRQAYDLLGGKTVFVNAAGCMTQLSIYPFTPFRGSWLYIAKSAAPAAAQGVRDALDILLAKGRLPPEEDLGAIALTGDGAAYGMGGGRAEEGHLIWLSAARTRARRGSASARSGCRSPTASRAG